MTEYVPGVPDAEVTATDDLRREAHILHPKLSIRNKAQDFRRLRIGHSHRHMIDTQLERFGLLGRLSISRRDLRL